MRSFVALAALVLVGCTKPTPSEVRAIPVTFAATSRSPYADELHRLGLDPCADELCRRGLDFATPEERYLLIDQRPEILLVRSARRRGDWRPPQGARERELLARYDLP